jgi:hypothetical protein
MSNSNSSNSSKNTNIVKAIALPKKPSVNDSHVVSYKYFMPDKIGSENGMSASRKKTHLYSDETTISTPKHLSESDLESLGTVDQKLLDHRYSESSHSIKNDFDEIRDLLKNTATLYNESAKLHMEQTRQISDIISTLKLSVVSTSDKFDKLTSILMLRNGGATLPNPDPQPASRTKTPERVMKSTVTNRPGSRKSQVLSNTHTFIPTVRSKSTTRLSTYEEV